jgi:CMP-N,N'-diacetyllegionaminic acid synthase
MMKNLAIIPARGGSKGLRDKNVLPLDGKPLLAHSVEAAFSSGCFDVVHVSTDSERYAGIARRFNADVPFLRSAETAADNASSWDVVGEVLEKYERAGKRFDTVVLLQPTSPLRTPEDIRRAYQLMDERHAEAVVSVCETDHSPLWCNTLPEDGCMDGFLPLENSGPRQALRPYYRINGAIYLMRVSAFRRWGKMVYGPECYACVMPRRRSVDIDTAFDFLLGEQLLRQERSGGDSRLFVNGSSSHEDNNRMIAIEAAVFSAESLEEARQSVSRLTKGASLEANDRELLSCDSKIIAGVLYEKRKQASLLHIEILAELRSEFRKSPLPETEWVEIIGILLDNAVEASKGGDQIHVRFCKTERSVELTVSNPFPPMSNTEFMRLFGKGVTTKQKEGGMHGYGLYNVLSIMERFHGKVITRNEVRNDRNYVVFGVKMELHRE